MPVHLKVTRAGRGGGSEVWELPADHTVGVDGALWDYVAELDAQLKVGHAQVVGGEVAGDDVPLAISVGGWPVEGVCCAGESPRSDEIVAADPGSHEWSCPGCGELVRPDRWTYMRLADPGPRGWTLPRPRLLARSCDAAARDLLAARDSAARARAQAAMRLLHHGGPGGRYLEVAAASPAGPASAPPGSVRAFIGPRRNDQTAGEVTVAYVCTAWHAFDDDTRRWGLQWREVGTAVLTSSRAFGLLWADPADSGLLDVETLHRIWQDAIGAQVPDWVCDEAAADDIAAAAERDREPRRAGAARGVEL